MRVRAIVAGLLVAGLLVAGLLVAGAVPLVWAGWTLNRPDGRRAPTVPGLLVTNEYAHWNADAADARRSSRWDVTSGSLYTRDGVLWTGPPDTGEPDAVSSAGTGSSVFRMHTHRTDYSDTHVTLKVRNLRLLPGAARTPARPTDGVHVMLRRQDETQLYVASVNRRDGLLVIKKKLSGGPVNGGRYSTLAGTRRPYRFGTWQHFDVRIMGTSPVVITVAQDGRELLRAVDGGSRGPPITRPGSVGVRGDSCEFEFSIRVR